MHSDGSHMGVNLDGLIGVMTELEYLKQFSLKYTHTKDCICTVVLGCIVCGRVTLQGSYENKCTSDTLDSLKETMVCLLEDLTLPINISLSATLYGTNTKLRGFISIWCFLP